MRRQHLVHEIEGTIARSLRSQDAATPLAALAGEHALELVGQLLILSVQVTNLTGSHANVACRHVLVGADMVIQLGHKGLTESHHLAVALAADAEVGASLSATHRQRGQGVLERLFEAQELQY